LCVAVYFEQKKYSAVSDLKITIAPRAGEPNALLVSLGFLAMGIGILPVRRGISVVGFLLFVLAFPLEERRRTRLCFSFYWRFRKRASSAAQESMRPFPLNRCGVPLTSTTIL